MKNVLLIGGAGYVGSVITSDFLRKNYKVTVLDNFIYDNQFSATPLLVIQIIKLFLVIWVIQIF